MRGRRPERVGEGGRRRRETERDVLELRAPLADRDLERRGGVEPSRGDGGLQRVERRRQIYVPRRGRPELDVVA